MSLHRDHGRNSTWLPRVAFPKVSWGNFQSIHIWERQQPVQTMLPLLLHSPSLPAPNMVTSYLPVMAPSFAHPAIYWHGNSCQQSQDILETNKKKKPRRPKDIKWGCIDGVLSDREGAGPPPGPGAVSHITPAFILKLKII